LHVEGNTVTGSLSDGEHHVAISDGKADGNKLSWQAKITKPMRLSFKFTALIEEDRISGTARHMLGTARFTGTRA
jgi:aerobic carbon-monoxide dehydrogenase large subunit